MKKPKLSNYFVDKNGDMFELAEYSDMKKDEYIFIRPVDLFEQFEKGYKPYVSFMRVKNENYKK